MFCNYSSGPLRSRHSLWLIKGNFDKLFRLPLAVWMERIKPSKIRQNSNHKPVISVHLSNAKKTLEEGKERRKNVCWVIARLAPDKLMIFLARITFLFLHFVLRRRQIILSFSLFVFCLLFSHYCDRSLKQGARETPQKLQVTSQLLLRSRLFRVPNLICGELSRRRLHDISSLVVEHVSRASSRFSRHWLEGEPILFSRIDLVNKIQKLPTLKRLSAGLPFISGVHSGLFLQRQSKAPTRKPGGKNE